eukprot:Protomagalhaensia_sp_Gyna_25__2050@NODE_20_length_7955_cov_303_925088_g13_i0_p2_GENE_NODE_20_length_7955_cov_303_925088_g13_i0NODE_20_length_7955_cov_303_925088_g13_i0_p2_ORF_typecomplete_len492_score69_42Peptidase_C48/PF02902_19/1e04Peptidase_C48/PF02902_19/8_8e39Acetyltransf_14/PF03421_16/0_11Peptidase_C57/PF03290_13/1_3e03Peptidase_C57/PF03290_13/0_4Peptidase_C57/PF03290_13/2e03_NODE_20_length_7955_cov_303_925088_g13_i057517226
MSQLAGPIAVAVPLLGRKRILPATSLGSPAGLKRSRVLYNDSLMLPAPLPRYMQAQTQHSATFDEDEDPVMEADSGEVIPAVPEEQTVSSNSLTVSPASSNQTPRVSVPKMLPRTMRWSDTGLIQGADVPLPVHSQSMLSFKNDKELYKKEIEARASRLTQQRSLFHSLNAKYQALSERLRSSLTEQLRFRSFSCNKLIQHRPPPVFVELSDGEEDLVNEVLRSAPLDPTKVVAIVDGVELTKRDMACLSPGEWLNDEVMNAYMNLLNARTQKVESCRTSSEGEMTGRSDYCVKTFYWNTFFYSSLTGETSIGQREYTYNRVKRWTSRKRIDIFSYDLLCIPLHIQKIHWALGVVDLRSKLVFFFDSLGSDADSQFFPTILQYLDDEHLDKKGSPLPDKESWIFGGNNYSHSRLVPTKMASHFRIFSSPETTTTHVEIPQQTNGSDCGVFACQYAEALGTARFPFPFSAQDIPTRRKRMALEILKGAIMFY